MKLADMNIAALSNVKNEKVEMKNHGERDEIAIIGMAVKLPGTDTLDTFWDNLIQKKCSTRDIPPTRLKDISRYIRYSNIPEKDVRYVKFGYLDTIDEFDHNYFNMSSKIASLMDPSQRIMLETAIEAFEDAGMSHKTLSGSMTGVYIGASSILGNEYLRYIIEMKSDSASLSIPGNMNSILASRISYFLNLIGPSLVVDTACSSSLVATHLACKALLNGECETAIAGGIKIHFLPIQQQHSLGVDSKSEVIRAFDDQADGTIFGEGSVAVVLKPLSKACEDKDNIYAVIKGSHINHDGNSITITTPNSEAQTNVILGAWKDAGIAAESLSYIETHGTGTSIGDPIEIDALTNAFQKYTFRKQFCAIGALKNNIGHTDSVSGLASLVKAVLVLRNRILPPNINFKRPNAKINFLNSPLYFNDALTKIGDGQNRIRCGVSAFGLSGTNCHMVLEEFRQEEPKAVTLKEEPNVFTISAKSLWALQQLVKRYIRFLQDAPNLILNDLCYTSNVVRGHYEFRVAIMCKTLGQLMERLQSLDTTNLNETGEVQPGIFYGDTHMLKAEKKQEIHADGHKMIEFKMIKGLNYDFQNYRLGVSNEDKENLLYSICNLYITGRPFDFMQLYAGSDNRKVRLPVYPFDRKRCWVEVENQKQYSEFDTPFYHKIWKQIYPAHSTAGMAGSDRVLILNDRLGYAEKIKMLLGNRGCEVITVELGSGFIKKNHSAYVIRPLQDDYVTLANEIKDKNITRIIHLSSLSRENEMVSISDFEKIQQYGSYALLCLCKSLIKSGYNNPLDVVLVSDYVSHVDGSEKQIHPHAATLFGLGKALYIETLAYKCRFIDIDDATTPDMLLSEIEAGYSYYHVAYRKGIRYTEIIDALDEKSLLGDAEGAPARIKENGLYIIAGGMGAIGLEIADYLASQANVKIALFNRRMLPNWGNGAEIIHLEQDRELAQKMKKMFAIQSKGSEIIPCCVDITQEADLRAALISLRKKYGKISGVIHSAAVGVGKKGVTIKNSSEQLLKETFLPKMQGTWLLDHLTRDDDLDFFMLFSSAATIIGGSGEGDYIASNAYLDSYAQYRENSGLKNTIIINWATWKETMKNPDGSKLMFKALSTEEAVQAFHTVLHADTRRVIIGELNHEAEMLQYLHHQLPINLSETIQHSLNKPKPSDGTALEIKYIQLTGKQNDDYTFLEKQLAQQFGNVLGLDTLPVDADFFELGGDSIIAAKICDNIGSQMFLKVDISVIIEGQTIEKIAGRILGEYGVHFPVSPVIAEPTADSTPTQCNLITDEKDMQQIIIEGILPFTDVFYKSCFYNSVFPVIRYFGDSITPVLLNDISVYHYSKGSSFLNCGVKLFTFDEDEAILNEMGIKTESKLYCADIISEIDRLIKLNQSVVVWIDCFYEPIRRDAYLKTHLAHTLLVYGYDDESYYIMEHKQQNSLSYEKTSIKKSDLKECYNGFLSNFFNKMKIPTFYSFAKVKDMDAKPFDPESSVFTYLKRMLEKKEMICNGLQELILLSDEFKVTLADKTLLTEFADDLYGCINKIVESKILERYKMHQLLLCYQAAEFNDLMAFLDTIINNWSFIRGSIDKFRLSSRFNENQIGMAISKLNEIVIKEQAYHDSLFKSLEMNL